MWKKNVETFLGCESNFHDAQTVIFGVPFDATTSYRPGTRFASKSMRAESFAMETYSPYQDKDLSEIQVFDKGELELPFGNTERVLQEIYRTSKEIYLAGKKPCMIGGEHLVTLAAVQACVEQYPSLHVIQLDAHTDLREDYLGEKLSHACVMRRVWELTGDKRIFQFGIRSGEKEEFLWAEKHTKLQKYNLNGLEKIVRELVGKPVYFTLDLDVLDPSALPGTGTPEPGGISFRELLAGIELIKELDIVGFDMNELSPALDPSGTSTATACVILREMLLAFTK